MKAILIVDDNAAVRLVLSEFLSLNYPHIEVFQAEDGVEGLTLAETENPDLILLDAKMPYMNGNQMAQKLRAQSRTKNIPIIAISGEPEEHPVAASLRELSDATLPKPFTADEMFAVINQVAQQEHAMYV